MVSSEQEARRPRPSAARADRHPRTSRLWDRAEYQRLWLQVGSHDWRTLAVVPGEEGLSTYDVATLVMVLGVSSGESIGLFDFRDVRVSRALEVIRDAERQIDRGERIVFATLSIRENLATIPLARATDAAILCVSIGSTSMRFAAETIEQIGRDRFIGSILVRPPADDEPAPSTSERRRLTARC